MAGILGRLAAFARSPRGQQLAQQAKTYAAKPENRRKIEQLRTRLAKKR